MKKILLFLPMLGLVAACGTLEQQQLAGTVGGAALGAAVAGPKNTMNGALVGGTLGLVAGSLIGRTATGQCVYQRPDGTRFDGPC